MGFTARKMHLLLVGLITEHLGNLPNNNTAIKLDGYQLTILNVDETM